MTYKLISHNGKVVYGKHLLLTANQCNESVLDLNLVTEFVRALVDKIGMQPYGDPIAYRIDSDTPYGGISVVQIIKTSTITIHTYDDTRDFYLDVFSCKEYDVETVLDYVISSFQPQKTSHQVVYRD